MSDLWDNPMGTDGFAFVEFAAPNPAELGALFGRMGFQPVANHRSKAVTLYRQGDINFIVNAEPGSFAAQFAQAHGPCACAMAFRVRDAARAWRRALELGAEPGPSSAGPMEMQIPCIKGIGGSLIYLVDRDVYDIDFRFIDGAPRHPEGCGLRLIDHLTHNVHRGHLDDWAAFYEQLFSFRQIRYFNIEGKLTGLRSRAMTSPDGKIRIPINETAGSTGRVDQIEEYLRAYRGEGIQHIALATDDAYASVEWLRRNANTFLEPPPDTYYDLLAQRLPNHGEDVARLQRNALLVDGAPGGGLLLQVFTTTVIGPIFFEVIQRKGDEGFGEGNFRALFESIEQDQIRRGVLDGGQP